MLPGLWGLLSGAVLDAGGVDRLGAYEIIGDQAINPTCAKRGVPRAQGLEPVALTP